MQSLVDPSMLQRAMGPANDLKGTYGTHNGRVIGWLILLVIGLVLYYRYDSKLNNREV